jgi:hypothetical protein
MTDARIRQIESIVTASQPHGGLVSRLFRRAVWRGASRESCAILSSISKNSRMATPADP